MAQARGLGEVLWDENWSGLFLFPLFYLSCHYVSSAVFNDGSSLQAVSGCIAVGGGDVVAAGGRCFFLFMSPCRQETKVSHMLLLNIVKNTVIRRRNAMRTWSFLV